MMDPSTLHNLFLELLRSAVWQRPANAGLFRGMGEEAWKSLADYSLKQSAVALIADAVSSLPPDSVPPKAVSIGLLLYADKIEESNQKLNRALGAISKDYESLGLPFVLLKGQGNAWYYPNPLHRSPGDLDLLFYRPGDYEKAKQWVVENEYRREEETLHHLGYYYKGVSVEIHHLLIYFTNEKYNKPLKGRFDEIIRRDKLETLRIDDYLINVLPAGFNAFYVFEHLFHHFIHTGIGVRQLCDWMLLLSARRSDIHRDDFTALARQFDLLNPMRVFAHACIKYLGAPPDIFPFDIGKDSRFSDLVMEDILYGGNFGFHREGFGPIDKKLKHKWHRYKQSVRRAWIFGKMSPAHIYYLPVNKFRVFLKARLMKMRR